MNYIRLFLTLLVGFCVINQVQSATVVAQSSGKWEQTGTWSGGVIPACGDSVVIGLGKTVEISSILDYSACHQAIKINISGTLDFQTGKKLRLPCNSIIVLNASGSITGGGGGGNSNLIDICNITVWNAAQGSLFGPAVITLNPLPVSLVHFSARPERDGICLTWLTASELFNKCFIVEKGKNGIDFNELGRMEGAGTTTNINSYMMVDKNPAEGLQYYRLKQVDFDGKTTTYQIVGVRWESGIVYQIFPNPTRGELFANIDPSYQGQSGQLLINRTDGKLILSKNLTFNEQTFGIKLLNNHEYLRPGSYIVTMNLRDKSYTHQVISK